MKDNPIITIDSEYIEWLKAIKQQISFERTEIFVGLIR